MAKDVGDIQLKVAWEGRQNTIKEDREQGKVVKQERKENKE